jgi:hypothetical protein
MADFDPENWLGGEAVAGGSKPVKLPERVQKNLIKGHEADLWTEDDVPEGLMDDGELDEALKIWKPIVEDSAKANKQTVYASDFMRFSKWFSTMYGEESETLGVGTTSSKVVVTKDFRADMDAQGMLHPIDMLGFELAHYLGRAVAA